jgi:hypothetical protein
MPETTFHAHTEPRAKLCFSTTAFSKTGRVSPDALQNVRLTRLADFPLGQLCNDARPDDSHGRSGVGHQAWFALIQTSPIRSWLLLATTFDMKRGVDGDDASGPFSTQTVTHFPSLGRSSRHLYVDCLF